MSEDGSKKDSLYSLCLLLECHEWSAGPHLCFNLRRGSRTIFRSECCTAGRFIAALHVNVSHLQHPPISEHEAGQVVSSARPDRDSNPGYQHLLYDACSMLVVSKHRAATQWRHVKKLLPCHAEPRPNWSQSYWNVWHTKHIAGAIEYHNPYRSERFIAAKSAQISYWINTDDEWAGQKLHVPKHSFNNCGPVRKNARLKLFCSAKKGCRPLIYLLDHVAGADGGNYIYLVCKIENNFMFFSHVTALEPYVFPAAAHIDLLNISPLELTSTYCTVCLKIILVYSIAAKLSFNLAVWRQKVEDAVSL